MNIKKASKSSLETYDSCGWLYFLQYICGIRSPSGKAATLGTIDHNVLEILARRKKTGKINNGSKINDPDFLLNVCFNSHSRKNPELMLGKTEFNLCQKWLKQILASPRNPVKLNVIDIEKGFFLEMNDIGFTYEFESYKEAGLIEKGSFCVNGFIDLVNEIEENGETVLEIVDYKFGRYKTDWATGKEKELEDFKKDLQLRCYWLAAKRLYPGYKRYKFTVVYVQLGKEFSVYGDEIDEVSAIDTLRRKFKKIIKDVVPIRLKDDSTRRDMHFKCRSVCYFGTTKIDGVAICDKYHQLFDTNKIAESARKIYQLAVNGKEIKPRENLGAVEQIKLR